MTYTLKEILSRHPKVTGIKLLRIGIRFTCPKHGTQTEQKISKFMQRRVNGCLQCGHLSQAVNSSVWSTKTIIAAFKATHGPKYNYSKVTYLGYYQKVSIHCKTHGIFTQLPHAHRAGNGCPKCFEEKRSCRVTLENLHLANLRKHQGRFDLSLIESVTKWSQQLRVVCPDHGEFSTRRSDFIQGAGCPFCYKDHKLVIGNRTFQVQGYERFALPLIIKQNGLKLSELFESKHPNKGKRPPRIDYNYKGVWRSHYPDFWIPHLNTLIEIKSDYTAGMLSKDLGAAEKLGILRAKKHHAERSGYKYVIFVVYRRNHETSAIKLFE